MSRYDDFEEVGGRPPSWDQPADQVGDGRRARASSGRSSGSGRYGQQRNAVATGRRRGLRKEVVLGAAAILATVIVVSTSLVAYARYRTVYSSIKRVSVSSAELGKHRPPYTAALNILIIGSDSRAGTNGAFGNASVITGARSDTVMLLHIAPGHQRADIISFPRDSMIPIYACQADTKDGFPGQQAQSGLEPLNSTFAYGGPVCLWKTIEQQTNIRIQHFIEVNFTGFQSIVDDVGGVSVCLPTAIDAPAAGLKLPAGLQTVTGAQALAFVRAREGVGDGSDLERIQRQQFFLDAVLQKLKSTNLLADPTRIYHVVADAAKSMTVDAGLDLSTMLKIADSMKSLNSGDVDFVSVPNGLYAPDPAKVLWTQPEADQLFSAIANDKTVPKPAATAKATATPSAAATVSRSQVNVEVLNGDGAGGLAATVGNDLTTAGFTVTGTGDVPGFGFTSSVIEYSSASQLAAANTLKAAVSGSTVKLDPTVAAGSITLIVGSNFNGLSSPSASPSASPSSAASDLTQTYGGITGTTNICKDSAAFAP
jgi:LCP family protein required for cell wall assembly